MNRSAEFTIKPLDGATWPALASLVESSDGFPSGCWCMEFHPEGAGKDTTAAINRERKEERVFGGEAHAALVFDGDDCVGWCQFGSPEELPRIKSRREYERTSTMLPDWRIGCSPRGTVARVWQLPPSEVRSS